MTTSRRTWACLTWAVLVVSMLSQEVTAMLPETPGKSFEFAFSGPGQLLAVASRGPDRPANYVLLLASAAGTTSVPVPQPAAAAWLSPVELILNLTTGSSAGELIRAQRDGHLLDVLSVANLAYPKVAPDGHHVSVVRFEDTPQRRGIGATEIHDLQAFEVTRSFPYRQLPTLFGVVVWSPDSTRFAVDLATDVAGRVTPQLGIVSLADGSVRRLYDGSADRDRDPGGVVPIMWTPHGLFVRGQRGVLRCDPNGNGCNVVYDPGNGRFVISGTPVGGDDALLLVQDLQADPLEARAKEVHRMSLTTGKGALDYRLPEDQFISAIDWVGDAKR